MAPCAPVAGPPPSAGVHGLLPETATALGETYSKAAISASSARCSYQQKLPAPHRYDTASVSSPRARLCDVRLACDRLARRRPLAAPRERVTPPRSDCRRPAAPRATRGPFASPGPPPLTRTHGPGAAPCERARPRGDVDWRRHARRRHARRRHTRRRHALRRHARRPLAAARGTSVPLLTARSSLAWNVRRLVPRRPKYCCCARGGRRRGAGLPDMKVCCRARGGRRHGSGLPADRPPAALPRLLTAAPPQCRTAWGARTWAWGRLPASAGTPAN